MRTLKLYGVILCQIIPAFSLLTSSAANEKGNQRPLVFVITGESNSGGSGRNSDASPKEMAPRPAVQIMNLTSGKFGFEDMQLGVNNLRDHFRMNENQYNTRHGFENQLANSAETGAFSNRKQVYLIKTGHGGSRIGEWTENSPSGYWSKFLERTNAGKRQLPGNPQWVVWFSLGINDAIAKTPIEKWEEEVRLHLKRIQKQLPGAIIVMTQFQSMNPADGKKTGHNYPDTDKAIAKIAADTPDVYAVDSTGAALVDRNHWSYAGLKTVTRRMVKITNQALGNGSLTRTKDPYIWAVRAGSELSGEKLRSLAVGADGFIYITGQFAGEADFGPYKLISKGGADCFVAKINSEGKFIWAKQIGGGAIERGYGIDADAQGHVFVTGHFQSRHLTFAGKELENLGDYDVFTASYDQNGKERWMRTGGGPGYDYGHGLDIMPGGGCVTAGRMVGPAALDGKILESKEKSVNLFVARYTDGGDLVWAKTGGIPASAGASDVAVEKSGNIWVCGSAAKGATYAETPLGKAEAGSLMVAKISGKDGSLIHATRFGGKAKGHIAGIIPDEANGGCYVSGAFEGEITLGPEKFVSKGDKDILVAYFDKDGNLKWIRSGGGTGWDLALGIGIDKAGHVLVTGFITEEGDFGRDFPAIKGPAREGFVSSYNRKGQLLWIVENGGSDNEINEDVAVDKEGYIINGGGFQTDGIFGRFKLTAKSAKGRGQDIFVTKFRKP